MFKRIGMFLAAGVLAFSLSGCVALLAGGAAGAGTAYWLSGKMTQQFNANYDQTITATKSSLQALNLPIEKEDRTTDVDQLRGQYPDGKNYWVDVRAITDHTTKVEVRVGSVKSDKAAAAEILRRIADNLGGKT